jgi:hypothetical protein
MLQPKLDVSSLLCVRSVLEWERGLILKKMVHTENLTILEAGGGWQEAHESSAPVGFHMADTPTEKQ